MGDSFLKNKILLCTLKLSTVISSFRQAQTSSFVRKFMVHSGFCIEIHWILNHCQQKFSNRTFSMMLATDDISGARAEPLYDKPCRCLQPGYPVEEIKGSKPKIWTWMYAPLSHNVTVAVFHIVWNSSCFMVLHIFGISWIGVIIHPYDPLFTMQITEFVFQDLCNFLL
jgi:hypothetical protein